VLHVIGKTDTGNNYFIERNVYNYEKKH